jgi:hypothetical protein
LQPENNSSTIPAFHSVLTTTTNPFFILGVLVFDFPVEDMKIYLTTPNLAR